MMGGGALLKLIQCRGHLAVGKGVPLVLLNQSWAWWLVKQPNKLLDAVLMFL